MDQRLNNLIKRRDEAQKNLERLRGRRDAAQADILALEEECRSKGLDPNNLEETIQKLRLRYSQVCGEVEQEMSTMEKEISLLLQIQEKA